MYFFPTESKKVYFFIIIINKVFKSWVKILGRAKLIQIHTRYSPRALKIIVALKNGCKV